MKFIFLSSLLLIFTSIFSQPGKNVNIDFMLRGHVYAHSSIEDSSAFGGFARSDNTAKPVKHEGYFSERGLSLKIDTSAIVVFNKGYNGYRLFLTNTSDSTVKLEASDSRLYAIAEVLYKGEWYPVEYLPGSWCGNSYHHIFLKRNEFWEFVIPKFSGEIKTKLRYRLMVTAGNYIYSNVISASINKGQLSVKKKYHPSGIMDPYND